LIRIPLKILPVELDVAPLMKESPMKYIYRYSEVIFE